MTMLASDTPQRSYLERRRQALLSEQALLYHRAITARNQAADLVGGRAHPAEIQRLQRISVDLQERCDQIDRAIRAIDADLRAESAADGHRAQLVARRTVLAAQLDHHRTVALEHWRQAEACRADADREELANNLAIHLQWAAERIESICHMFVAAIRAIDAELGSGEVC
jgi:hypothetical protein